jgi:hypothetical protein
MINLLGAACHAVNEIGSPLPADRMVDFLRRYEENLTAGEIVNPPVPRSGKRARTRQRKPAPLTQSIT